MKTRLKMVYWKNEKFWVGKLVDHPEVVSQAETLQELKVQLLDAYKHLVLTEHTLRSFTDPPLQRVNCS